MIKYQICNHILVFFIIVFEKSHYSHSFDEKLNLTPHMKYEDLIFHIQGSDYFYVYFKGVIFTLSCRHCDDMIKNELF